MAARAVPARLVMSRQFVSPLAIRDGFAYGWARRDGQRQVEVHLWLDGRHVATEYTGVALPAFSQPACGRPPSDDAGFVFGLPQEALDGFAHDLHAALPAADGESLHGQVQPYEHSTVRGEVRQQGRQFVGTVWFKSRAPRRPHLDVTDGVGSVVSRLALAVSSAAGKHGYPAQFAVPCESLPHGTLHFSCRGQALRGSPCTRRSSVLGVLEQADGGGVAGWAFDSADLGRPLELCLRIDGRAMTWFRPNMRRPEIEARLGQAEGRVGLIGFRLPLPPGVAGGGWRRLEVVAADDGQPLSDGHRMVRVERSWIEHRPSRRRAIRPVPAPPSRATRAAPQVSVIILNRNGGQVLSAFLESWERHNTVPAEVIVVDHASTDTSLAMLDRWRTRLDLTVLALDRNDSFSASCNRGAQQARGEYLLFVNNDIVWLQDALPRMLESLQQPDTGVVGVKLLKAVGESQHALAPATEVQHLGVRFKLNELGYWPYEIAPAPCGLEDEHAPQVVPAVTGAVMLCRKSDFDRVGGFAAQYFYGFEDVELCLRLSQRLCKLVVCRNDVCALHRHGHTRLSGREMGLFERVQSNADVLQSDMGLWLKQAYWRSLLRGDGYMTTEALTIGFVVDSAPAGGAASPLARDAARLAARLNEALPHARVVFLPPERGWKNAADLHVLVVGTPQYDLRAVHGARADLLTVAWIRSQPRQWAAQPWWLMFGGYLAPAGIARGAGLEGVHITSPGPAAPLGDLLDASRWRMRVAVQVPLAAADLEGSGAIAMRARELQLALKAAGFPCWLVPLEDWETAPAMSDACVTLHTASSPPRAPRPDVLNVLWLCDDARKPGHWQARHGIVTREQPTPQILLEALEKSIGNTFHPS